MWIVIERDTNGETTKRNITIIEVTGVTEIETTTTENGIGGIIRVGGGRVYFEPQDTIKVFSEALFLQTYLKRVFNILDM